MQSESLLTIGEFARRSRLTIKALRLYDRTGLLRPAETDPVSGYRRYAPRQLYAARLIMLLRRLDMPLAEIAEIVNAGAPGAAARLDAYWSGVERRLATQRELADRLVRSLAGEAPEPAQEWTVHERDVPEQLVLAERGQVTSAELPAWIRAACARLLADADRHGGPAGPWFVLFHSAVAEDAAGIVEVCVPVGAGDGGRREPAHREAYIPVAAGHFEPPRIMSVYDAVYRYVRMRGGEKIGPAREVHCYPDGDRHVCDVALPFA